ncbi:MAG: hypothetical protein O3B22_14935, partial [Proteobacteria bacterium]|nr:hypothetical protein [Pseudomonadota bacterium]
MHRVVLVLTCLVLAACSQAQHATAPVSPAPDLPEEPASVAMAAPENGRCQTKAIRYPKIVMHQLSGRKL